MKRGRKQQHHIDSKTGLPVVGLSRMSDGRWRLIGTQTRYSEPDERKAIERFRKLTSGLTPAQQRMVEQPNPLAPHEDDYVRWVVDALQNRREWLAKKTGVEWIAYGPELKQPQPIPSPDELLTNWKTHATASKRHTQIVVRAWNDFISTTGIVSLKEIDAALVVAFRDQVHKRKLKGKTQSHLFGGIRRIISFNKQRAVSVWLLSEIQQHLQLLKANQTTVSIDPKPIEPAVFMKLVDSTDDNRPEEKALLFLGLNCCMYLQEAVRLKWSDIRNGCLVARREKTGRNIRCAVLWPETLAAIKRLPKKGDYLFWGGNGLPLTISGAERRWRRLVARAEVEATASQLRDAAFTTAVEANVNEQLCKLYSGHSCGMSDHYVARKPSMVKPACDAVRARYITAKNKTAVA